jgi:hypothetical protein
MRARLLRGAAPILALGLTVLGACGDGIPLRDSPADSLATVRLVELITAMPSAPDPLPAWKAMGCEQTRVRRVVTALHGHLYAMGVLRAAERRARRQVPDSMFRQLDQRLPLTLPAMSDEECVALARASILGDTIFPPAGEFKP